MSKNMLFKSLFFLLIIPILAEIFLFNFRYWESLTFEGTEDYKVTRSANEIVLNDIDVPVRNIYIDCPQNNSEIGVVHLRLSISDEAVSDYALSATEVIPELMESRYLRIYTDGKVNTIKITFSDQDISDTSDITVGLNVKRPFSLHPFRLLAVAVILMLFFIFKPGSKIYEMPLCVDGKMPDRNKIFTLAAISLSICLWTAIVLVFAREITGYIYNEVVEGIYTFQAQALLKGQVHLDIKPPDYLSEMTNPYHSIPRIAMMEQTGEPFKLDFAFFNGKYYCYYGIVPVLLMYLPCLMLTGMPLNNYVPILLFGMIIILFAYLFLFKLVRRHYSNISLGLFLLLGQAFFFGTGVLYCAHTSLVYSVVFISAIAFTLVALYNWLSASDKHFENKLAPLSKTRLLIGAVSMGLAIGCRPVFGIYLFLIFPLFYSEIKERLFFSKKGLGNTLCVIVPLLLIGSGLLYFNKLRFGSFFDFGFTYNLSEADINSRHWGIRRLWLGFLEYLFQPVRFRGTFPYIVSIYDAHSHSTDYLGYQFFDAVYGGFFAICPVFLSVFFIKKCKNALKDMKMYYFAVLSLLFAAVLLLLNIEMAGITLRYQLDFAMLISFSGMTVLIALFRTAERSSYKKAFKILLLSVIVLTGFTVFINMMLMISDVKQRSLLGLNPNMYYSLKYLFFSLR